MTVVRRLGLDVLKGVAIVMVVFNHALLWPMRSGDAPSAFAYGTAFWTVAAFSAVAGYVHGLHPPREEWSVVRRRAGQLLVPWVVWAPVYALVPWVWERLGGGAVPLAMEPVPWAVSVLLGGGPLWFLPVLFSATAICAVCDLKTRSWWPAVAAVAAYAVVAVASSAAGRSPLDVGKGTFWPVAPLYIAAFWFGLRTSRDPERRPPHSVLAMLIGATLIASGAVTYWRSAAAGPAWLMWFPYAIGLVGGCAALLYAVTPGVPGASRAFWQRGAAVLARAGRASLGVYVLHPALVAPLALLVHGRGGVLAALVTALAVVAVAVPAVERLRVSPLLRRVV